jgi:hypothetical protein
MATPYVVAAKISSGPAPDRAPWPEQAAGRSRAEQPPALVVGRSGGFGKAAHDLGQRRFDAVESGVGRRFQLVESGVNTVESGVNTVEPAGHTVEPASHTVESGVNTVEPAGHTVESGVNTVEPAGHTVESGVNTVESDGHTVESDGHTVESDGESRLELGEALGVLLLGGPDVCDQVVDRVGVVLEPRHAQLELGITDHAQP